MVQSNKPQMTEDKIAATKIKCDKQYVKAPPMVGPTWMRVCLTLGSDCSLPLFQGTILLLLPALCSICWLLVHVRCQMIQGCTSTLPPLVPHPCMCPWGLSFLIMCVSTFMVVCIPWWTMCQVFTMDYSPHVCWCSMGFITILLLLAIVLGSRYFGY